MTDSRVIFIGGIFPVEQEKEILEKEKDQHSSYDNDQNKGCAFFPDIILFCLFHSLHSLKIYLFKTEHMSSDILRGAARTIEPF